MKIGSPLCSCSLARPFFSPPPTREKAASFGGFGVGVLKKYATWVSSVAATAATPFCAWQARPVCARSQGAPPRTGVAAVAELVGVFIGRARAAKKRPPSYRPWGRAVAAKAAIFSRLRTEQWRGH